MASIELNAMASVHIASAVSGRLDISMIGRDRVRKRPLCMGQRDLKTQGGHRQTTIKADDWSAEVTVNVVSNVYSSKHS